MTQLWSLLIYIVPRLILATATLLLGPRCIRYVWQLYVLRSVSRDGMEHLPLPPGTMGYPLVGETLSFLMYGAQFYKGKMEKYGRIYKTHLLGNPTIRVIGAENLRKILLSEGTLVTQIWPLSTRLLLGPGSTSQSTGHVHKLRRKHMIRTFNYEAFSTFVPIIQSTIKTNLSRWRHVADFTAYPECKRLTFETAARTLFGLDQESASKHDMHQTFCEFTKQLMSIPIDLPGFGFRQGMKAKAKLMSNLRELLPKIRDNHFSLLDNETYPKVAENEDEDIEYYEGLIDVLFAGHETVSSTNTNIMMFLGQNKHVVDNIRAELEEHNLLEDTDNITFADVNDLKYINHVIKEVLRLCPPVGGGFRRVLKSFELGGFHIPEGWTVIYSIRETQHTSPVFPDSEKYDPDRWKHIEEVNKTCPVNVERFHYTPFGYGQRGCVGQVFSKLVMKIFLVELVRAFDWTLKNENPVMRYIPTPMAVDGLPLILHDRT